MNVYAYDEMLKRNKRQHDSMSSRKRSIFGIGAQAIV
jgi:hypothetical protein